MNSLNLLIRFGAKRIPIGVSRTLSETTVTVADVINAIAHRMNLER